MSRANIAPAEVKAVAGKLRSRAAEVQSVVSGLKSDVGSLGSAWNDEGYARFKDVVEKTISQLAQFKEAAEQHAAFLNKKADAAEAYLKIR